MSGTLYVVSTPIGNLEDLSPRAARTLAEVGLILAEDTRVTQRLLSHLGLRKTVRSCYRENETARVEEALAALQRGEDVALCSDAGSPAVSDPGAALVTAAHDAGIRVVAIAGPSAVTAALSVAGFPAGRFLFVGFLPRRGKERSRLLAEIARAPQPVLLFESPARVCKTLEDLAGACGRARMAVVCRELTKLHEEVVRGPLEDLCRRFQTTTRGELTLVVSGAPEEASIEVTDETIAAALRERPQTESLRQRVDVVSTVLGVKRKRVYDLALQLASDS